MPEGPEVKRISEKLSRFITGEKITSVDILSGRYLKHGPPDGFEDFARSLPATVTKVDCKGKFIYILFDNGYSMWNTLGMAGSWSPVMSKHSRLKLNLKEGSAYFNDVRNFGTVRVSNNSAKLKEKLDSLGPDMLSENVTNSMFVSRIMKKPTKTVAEAIMNQSVICGVGNYLKSESLYLARISPHRIVETLSHEEMSNLNAAIQCTIRSSYASGGATIHTFLDFDGKQGEYSRRFAVYNQKSDIAGNNVVRETTKDGRTSFWVPELQK
jgi:DNA-formamidopyrimidine glycosylase